MLVIEKTRPVVDMFDADYGVVIPSALGCQLEHDRTDDNDAYYVQRTLRISHELPSRSHPTT